jgi:hypothetical protein
VLAAFACPPASEGQTMSWLGNFGSIGLPDLDTRTGTSTGSANEFINLNGDIEISADNSAAAQLSGPGGEVLVTEYSLSFNGDGSSATGGPPVDYTPHDSFLVPPAQVTHVPGDNFVRVTLGVRASHPSGDVADAGDYTATQTLTASWVGP